MCLNKGLLITGELENPHKSHKLHHLFEHAGFSFHASPVSSAVKFTALDITGVEMKREKLTHV